MAKYQYKRGDKPLEGYTIEHGLGVGGFGEVYFAISDAGREVALKAIQNFEEIELRGIRHCMNLKSPHLVSVFDVRHNADENPFVIMEYVQGPSLRELLDAAPDGIGPTKAAFFLREMAKGLNYLHEAGVVHRDLKPHNVFYEEGYVKIGDYSLCKLMSTSHRTGHTMTVGTVHYMAPEISEGRYDASVDIYALGIMLYEMLTGAPPFVGETLGEVLLKHMTAEPDLSRVEEPFRHTIAKALAKNPDDRFASAAEMVEAIFGVDHVQNSVVEFNPQELTMVANMAAKRAFTTPSGRPASSRPGGASWGKTWRPDGTRNEPCATEDSGIEGTVAYDSNAPAAQPPALPDSNRREIFTAEDASPNSASDATSDPMPAFARCATAAIAMGGVAVLSQLVTSLGFTTAVSITSGTLVALIAGSGLSKSTTLPRVAKRVLLGLSVFFAATIFGRTGPIAAVAIPFALFDWPAAMRVNRVSRLDGRLLIQTVFVSFLLSIAFMRMYKFHAFGPIPIAVQLFFSPLIAFGIGLCLQILSPFSANALRQTNASATSPPEPTAFAQQTPHRNVAGPTAAPLATDRSANAIRTKTTDAESPSQILGAVSGGITFFASCVLCLLAVSAMTEVDLIDRDTARILATVGFGLIIFAFGALLKSEFWSGTGFLRLTAACGIIASLHFAMLTMVRFPPEFGIFLPVAVGLICWPNRKSMA